MAFVKKLLYRIFRWFAIFSTEGEDEHAFIESVFIYQIDGWFESYGLVQAIQAYFLWRHEGEEEDDNPGEG